LLDLEPHFVAFLQALVTFTLNGAVVDEQRPAFELSLRGLGTGVRTELCASQWSPLSANPSR